MPMERSANLTKRFFAREAPRLFQGLRVLPGGIYRTSLISSAELTSPIDKTAIRYEYERSRFLGVLNGFDELAREQEGQVIGQFQALIQTAKAAVHGLPLYCHKGPDLLAVEYQEGEAVKRLKNPEELMEIERGSIEACRALSPFVMAHASAGLAEAVLELGGAAAFPFLIFS